MVSPPPVGGLSADAARDYAASVGAEQKRLEKQLEREAGEAAEVREKEYKLGSRAQAQYEQFQRSRESAEDRRAAARERMLREGERRELSEERQRLARERRWAAIGARAPKSDADLYQEAKTDIYRERELETGVRPREGDVDQSEIRSRIERMRAVQETAGEIGGRLREQGEGIVRPTLGPSITEADVEKAGRSRYVMPAAMRQWKYATWLASIGDPKMAMEMAAEASRQAKLYAAETAEEPAEAVSGRTKAPAKAATAAVGIGASNRPPASRALAETGRDTIGGVGVGMAAAPPPPPVTTVVGPTTSPPPPAPTLPATAAPAAPPAQVAPPVQAALPPQGPTPGMVGYGGGGEVMGLLGPPPATVPTTQELMARTASEAAVAGPQPGMAPQLARAAAPGVGVVEQALGLPGELVGAAGEALGAPPDWRQRALPEVMKAVPVLGPAGRMAQLIQDWASQPPKEGETEQEKALKGLAAGALARGGEMVTDPLMAALGMAKVPVVVTRIMQGLLVKGLYDQSISLYKTWKEEGLSDNFYRQAGGMGVDLASIGGLEAASRVHRAGVRPAQEPPPAPRTAQEAPPPARAAQEAVRPAETALERAVREASEAVPELPSRGRALDQPGSQANASLESAASAEAISRQATMKMQGKKYVVFDRAGNERPLIGPEAVDYRPRPGETYGIKGPRGFEVLEANGGRVPDSALVSETTPSAKAPTAKPPSEAAPPPTGANPPKADYGQKVPWWHRWMKPAVERIREMKTAKGEPVGEKIAQGFEEARDYGEAKGGQYVRAYDDAIARLKTQEGKGFDRAWARTVESLNGDRPYSSLKPTEQAAYDSVKAFMNDVKRAGKEAGTFSGQEIDHFFPHMRERPSYEALIESHAEWMRNTPEGQARANAVRKQHKDWVGGPSADLMDLAQMDLSKNYGNESWQKKYGHLERVRTDLAAQDFRRDPGVVREYLYSAWERIAHGRYLGPGSEVAKVGSSLMSPEQRQFVADTTKKSFGYSQPGLAGGTFERAGMEVRAVMGLTKLGLSQVRQMAQAAVPSARAIGVSGIRRGVSNLVRASRDYVFSHAQVARDAAVSTPTALRGEIFERHGGVGETVVGRALKLGGRAPEAWKKFVDTTWGMETVDKGVRQWSDRAGRLTFIDAVRRKNLKALEQMLRSKELAQEAVGMSADALEARLSRGEIGKPIIEPGPRGGKTTEGTKAMFDRGDWLMDRAAKLFVDETNYRTRAENIPLAQNTPVAKVFNTFMAFPYQHWRWNVKEVGRLRSAMKSGDRAGMARAARTLITYHAVMAPLWGSMSLAASSLLKGRGLNEEDIESLKADAETPREHLRKLAQAYAKISSTRPIDKSDMDAMSLAIAGLQAWQYAGGVGYPDALLARGARSFNFSGEEYGETWQNVSGFAGAPVQSVAEVAVGATDFVKYLLNSDDKVKYTPARVRQLYRQWINNIGGNLMPNPFGLGRAALGEVKERVAPSKTRPNFSPGWVKFLFGDEDDWYWTPEHGVTSEKAERQREELKKREARERARRKMLSRRQ